MQHGCSPAWMRAAGCTTLVSAALLTFSLSNVVAAQDAASSTGTPRAAAASQPYVAVVSANAVNVRSGPSAQSAYVFGKLRSGDTVQVVAEEFGWARIRTTGPAFGGMEAFVPADRRLTVEGDVNAPGTKVGRVTGRTEVRAPNVDAGSTPERSWKQIGVLDAGATVEVRGVTAGEKESVYKIALPGTAEGWVNLQFLRRATESEVAMHTAALATPPAAPLGAPVVASVQTPSAAAPTASTPPAAMPVASRDPALSSPAIPPLMGDASARAGVGGGTAPGAAPVAIDSTHAAIPAGTKLDSHGEGSLEATAAPRVKLASEIRRGTWNDLEAEWQAVRQQPLATAELDALRGRYTALSSSAPAGSAVAQMAKARSEQLSLMQEAQKQSQELAAIKGKLSERTQAMVQLVLDIQRRAEYSAVGILNASVVYDGKRLPQLYRITDPQTSQTIAYVLPNESIAMGTMLGTLVGVKGGKDFDSALNINVISPQVIELLTVRDTPQVSKVGEKTDAAKPATGLAERVPAQQIAPEPKLPTDDPDCWEEVPPLFLREVPPSTTP